MSKLYLIMSAVLMLTLLVLVAPGILALNRGKMLRNIALWLAIALGLALVFHAFGPGRNQGLPVKAPYSVESGADAPGGATDAGDQDYTPPKE